MKLQIRKKAFTLAEVLITMTIIGIVTALLLPTVVQHIQEKSWNSSAEVFEKKLEESLKVMNSQGVLAGYRTTEAFVQRLSQFMKISKICDNNHLKDCFESKIKQTDNSSTPIDKMKTSLTVAPEDWGTNTVGVNFGNGVIGLLVYNPNCVQDQFSNNVSVRDCVAIAYDVNGPGKPNTVSKDVRTYNTTGVVGLIGSTLIEKVPFNCSFSDGLLGVDFITVEASDSKAVDYTGQKSYSEGPLNFQFNASADGTKMTFALAKLTCESKGLRIPHSSELNSLYKASKSGLISSFASEDYWASTFGSSSSCDPSQNKCFNCNMGGGNCGATASNNLKRLRCVK